MKVDGTTDIVDAIDAAGTAVVNIVGGEYDGGQTPLGGAGNTAIFAHGSATVNIEDGTFKISKLADGDTGHIDLIYAKENATINISGGTFEGEDETVWLLNVKDADRETAKIVVTGGKFKNWNPADNAAEGPGTNFVAEGYTVLAEDFEDGSTWYTVVKETA